MDNLIVTLAQMIGFLSGMISGIIVSTAVLYSLQIEAFSAAAMASIAAGAVCATYAGRCARKLRGVTE